MIFKVFAYIIKFAIGRKIYNPVLPAVACAGYVFMQLQSILFYAVNAEPAGGTFTARATVNVDEFIGIAFFIKAEAATNRAVNFIDNGSVLTKYFILVAAHRHFYMVNALTIGSALGGADAFIILPV